MRSGETIPADLIILATGYKGQEHLVGKLFGNDVATRVGPIWGFGNGDELPQYVYPHGSTGSLVYRDVIRQRGSAGVMGSGVFYLSSTLVTG
jgi:hypothetical protein